MENFLGTSIGIFIGISGLLMGGAAYMTGQAVANIWGPFWQVLVYCFLLGLGSRFLIYALFEGKLLSLTGLIADVVVLTMIGSFAYRVTAVAKMVSQYPWLYERVGLFGYREKAG